jgi:hypothetical protein
MSELPIVVFIIVPLALVVYVALHVATRDEKNPYYWIRYEFPLEVWQKIRNIFKSSK